VGLGGGKPAGEMLGLRRGAARAPWFAYAMPAGRRGAELAHTGGMTGYAANYADTGRVGVSVFEVAIGHGRAPGLVRVEARSAAGDASAEAALDAEGLLSA
jgi:hypothetical protein